MTKKKASSSKKIVSWGKAGRAALAELIRVGDVDIDNISIPYIDSVQAKYFGHLKRRNFHRNYREYAAAWDTEVALNGERKKATSKGKY
jgi:hypothetical protein